MPVALFNIRMLALKLFLFSLIFLSVIRIWRRNAGHSQSTNRDLEEIIDEIILIMQTGVSYESAIFQISQRSRAGDDFFSFLESERHQNGKKIEISGVDRVEIAKILRFCRENSSLSFKMLLSLRHVLRLRRRLHHKQRSITLQARAQAVVSAAIFVVLVCAQWKINPEFQRFMASMAGRLVFCASTLLVGVGLYLVLALSRPEEMHL
jgi:Flp pilus assembly protein TadB